MTNTVLSPNGVESYSIRTIVVPGLGAVAPAGSLTPAEVQDLRDDVASVLGMGSGDLADVDLTGIDTGMILVRRSGQWVPEVPSVGLGRVATNWNAKEISDVTYLTVGAGIDINTGLSTGGRAHLRLVFGASGTQDVVARANHTHPPTRVGKFRFDKSGAILSLGESMLVEESIGGLIPGVTYDIFVTGSLEVVNTNQSGRVQLMVKIGSGGGHGMARGASGGVWTEMNVTGTQMSLTGVTSVPVTFWVEYLSGDPTALYSGSLSYIVTPRGGTS